jgi:hypothetical protein
MIDPPELVSLWDLVAGLTKPVLGAVPPFAHKQYRRLRAQGWTIPGEDGVRPHRGWQSAKLSAI